MPDSETFQEVTRLNYGVVYTPVRLVTLVSDEWSHIFDLHLPNVTTVDPELELPQCDAAISNDAQNRTKQTCERNRQVILELHKQHIDMIRQIRRAIQHINHLLPTEKRLPRPFGRKRSLLPIGGNLLHALFGTTTDDDLRPLKDHISRIAKGISHLGHGLQVQQHQFSSFIELSANRMDAFSEVAETHENALQNLREKLNVLYDTEGRDQHRLITAIRQLQQYINQLRNVDELRQSVELLLHGILTPQLVPKITLRTTLLNIKSELRRRFPGSRLIFERATDFYAMSNFRFGRHDNHLLILLQAPITIFEHQFQMFKVTSFPVYVTGQTSHTTLVQNLPSYFAVSRDSVSYFTLPRGDDLVHTSLLRITDKQITFRDLNTGASCVSALFQNDVDKVSKLCSFSLHKQSLEPSIFFLTNGDILTTNLSHVTINCNDTKISIPDCTQCVRTLPCHCSVSISTENSSYPNHSGRRKCRAVLIQLMSRKLNTL